MIFTVKDRLTDFLERESIGASLLIGMVSDANAICLDRLDNVPDIQPGYSEAGSIS